MTIFFMALKDMQDTPTYEEALKLLVDTREGEEVVADRDLFESGAEYRRNWKSVYGGAERFYILAHEDGTVGKGIYQQWIYLSERMGVPAVVLFGGNERGWYERFSLEVVGKREEGEGDDMERYAVVRLGGEGRQQGGDGVRGSERDWMAPEEILLKIAARLQSAAFGLGHPYSGKIRAHVERAQDVLEEMLGTLPPNGFSSVKKPLDHLEEADALAKEHLGMSGAELDLSEAVTEAARQARREF